MVQLLWKRLSLRVFWVCWQWRGWYIVINKSQGGVAGLKTETFFPIGPWPSVLHKIVLTGYNHFHTPGVYFLRHTHTHTHIHMQINSLVHSGVRSFLPRIAQKLKYASWVCCGGIQAVGKAKSLQTPDDKHSDPFWPHWTLIMQYPRLACYRWNVMLVDTTQCETASSIGSTIQCATTVNNRVLAS